MIAHGRIPYRTGRPPWDYDPRARALDERLDAIDLELEGLARIRCENATAAAASLGFSVEGIRPLVARPWESRVETQERRRARAALNPPRRTANGKPLLERRSGQVLAVR
jgi:hypothetical protein